MYNIQGCLFAKNFLCCFQETDDVERSQLQRAIHISQIVSTQITLPKLNSQIQECIEEDNHLGHVPGLLYNCNLDGWNWFPCILCWEEVSFS